MSSSADHYDLKNVIASNKLVGLFRLAHGYQAQYIIANFSLGFSAMARTATSFLLRFFVDDYLTAGDRRFDILVIALGFVVLAAGQGFLTFISGKLAAQTSEGVTQRLRNYLFDHIQRLSFAYHNRTDTGELIQRVTSDVDAIRRFYAEQAIGLGRILFMFVVNFAALLTIDIKLAFISIIVIPFIVVVSRYFFSKVSALYESYQEQEAVLSTTLQENLTGVRVVKAFARQQYEISKFEKDNWENFLRGKRLTTMHALFWPMSDVLCGFQMLAGYLVAAVMAINGQITIGDLPGICQHPDVDHLPNAQPWPLDRTDVHRDGLI